MRVLTSCIVSALLLAPSVQASDAETLEGWQRFDVLQIHAATGELADYLDQEGFRIDPEYPAGMLVVHATEQDRKRLDARGIGYSVIGTHPNPPNFSKDAKGLGTYHSYTSLSTELAAYAENFPNITRLVSLGQSIEEREIWALLITDNPDVEEAEPEFKYVSTMHGDEPVGTELCLYLIDLLLNSYGETDTEGQRLTSLVNDTEIWIVPLMNPDGHVAGSRYNANTVDLNRSFPSYVLEPTSRGFQFEGTPLNDGTREQETRVIMQWTAGQSFVLSANLHSGALLVNYPFDEGGPTHQYVASPDDDLFIDISKRYSVHNSPMWNSPSFDMGITNGSDWYTIYGGMQDWNYRYVACNEVTIELANIKKPSESLLPTYWANNKESMLAYMASIHMGIRGVVTDEQTGDPVWARIDLAGNEQPVFTDPDVGDYYRLVLPGTYGFTVSAPGYEDITFSGVTVSETNPTTINVQLRPEGWTPEGEGGAEGEGDVPAVHSADMNGDNILSLSEILRLIQLYQTTDIGCDAGSEDGYSSESTDTTSCPHHSSDYNPADWEIALPEVLRAVQFYNMGGYTACPGGDTEDGYCVPS